MVKLNINTASTRELLKIRGIGNATAKKIEELRGRGVVINSFDELKKVTNISPSFHDDIANAIDFGGRILERPDITIPPLDIPDFVPNRRFIHIATQGHQQQQHAYYQAAVSIESELGPIAYPTYWQAKQQSYLLVLARELADSSAEVSLLTPQGEVVSEHSVVEGAWDDLVITLPKPPELSEDDQSAADDPLNHTPVEAKGRLINASDQRIALNRLQLLVWLLPKEHEQHAQDLYHAMGQGFAQVFASVTPSGQGRFTLPYPKQSLARAWVTMALPNSPLLMVPVRPDDTFPEEFILVLNDIPELSESDAEKVGCGCDSPDAELSGFARVQEQLGGGTGDSLMGDCPKFSANNVVLDEFEFTTAVRTSQPQVEALSLDNPEAFAQEQIELLHGQIRALLGELQTLQWVGTIGPIMQPMMMQQAPVYKQLRQLIAGNADLGEVMLQLGDLAKRPDIRAWLDKYLSVPRRPKLSGDNPLDWDDQPSVSQAVTVAHGHLLRIKQEWVSDGYSLGELLHTTALAPGQVKRIAIIDWQRSDEAAQTTEDRQGESLRASLQRDRGISETVQGTVSQYQEGRSSATTAGIGAAGGIAGVVGKGLGFLGVAGGVGHSRASSSQSGRRKMSASSVQRVSDSTQQSSSAQRRRNTASVVSADQAEDVVATTEVIANYNHCHSLNVHHFQVLRNYLIRTRLADVQECLFVPLKMSPFDIDKIQRWQDVLIKATPWRYRVGYRALERLQSYWLEQEDYLDSAGETRTRAKHAQRLADNEVDVISGQLVFDVYFRRPLTMVEEIQRRRAVEPRLEGESRSEFERRLKQLANAAIRTTWAFTRYLGESTGLFNVAEQLINMHEPGPKADKAFSELVFPELCHLISNNLRFAAVDEDGEVRTLSASSVDTTLLGYPRNGGKMRVNFRINYNQPRTRFVQLLVLPPSNNIDENGQPLDLFPSYSRLVLAHARVHYRMDGFTRRVFRGRLGDDLIGGGAEDHATIDTPISRYESRNLLQLDLQRAKELIAHINRELEGYHHYLWYHMDPARRFMLLDGVAAPNANGLSVAQVVSNEVAGMVGNSLVMPVSRGIFLTPDPTMRPAQDELGRDKPFDLLDHYQPTTPIDPIRVALPTGGVHAEAVMGSCNSCEHIDESRYWKWEEHPIPYAPNDPAASLLGSRFQGTDLGVPGLAPALVGYQTPQSLPDPQGVAGVLTQLMNSQGFSDAAGLSETQRSAMTAYVEGIRGATEMANKAQQLLMPGPNGSASPVQQRYVASNIDQLVEKIDQSKLPKEEKDRLTSRAFQTVVGDLPAPSPEPSPSPSPDTPSGGEGGGSGGGAGGGSGGSSGGGSGGSSSGGSSTPTTHMYFIKLSDSKLLFLNFPVGKDQLLPQHQQYVASVFQQIGSLDGIKQVVGHASRQGSRSNNQALSERRAQNLLAAFRQQASAPFPATELRGVGEDEPTIRANFGHLPVVAGIAGNGHVNDPVERSVLLELKPGIIIDTPPPPSGNHFSIGDVNFSYTDNSVSTVVNENTYEFKLFSDNQIQFLVNNVFKQIIEPGQPKRLPDTTIDINFSPSLVLQIGDILFDCGGGVLKRRIPEVSGDQTFNWDVHFSTPQFSAVQSIYDIVEDKLRVLLNAEFTDQSEVKSDADEGLFDSFTEWLDDSFDEAKQKLIDELVDKFRSAVEAHPAGMALRYIKLANASLHTEFAFADDAGKRITGKTVGANCVLITTQGGNAASQIINIDKRFELAAARSLDGWQGQQFEHLEVFTQPFGESVSSILNAMATIARVVDVFEFDIVGKVQGLVSDALAAVGLDGLLSRLEHGFVHFQPDGASEANKLRANASSTDVTLLAFSTKGATFQRDA